MPAAITAASDGHRLVGTGTQTRARPEFLAGLDDEDPDANHCSPMCASLFLTVSVKRRQTAAGLRPSVVRYARWSQPVDATLIVQKR